MILPQFSCTARFERGGKSIHQRRTRSAPRLLLQGGAFTNFISGEVCYVVLRAANRPPQTYRSGRLQEEQRLVAKTCSFFWRILLSPCPNFAELESSKEAKSYHENPCNRITCKKILPPPLPPPGESGCHPKKT